MNKIILWAIILVLIIGGGYWYMQNSADTPADSMAKTSTMGAYPYTCANGSQFTMTPSEDVSEVTLAAGSQGMFTGTIRLARMGDANHFETTEGQLVVFSGAGEEVQITVGSETTVCNPVPNPDSAPWNWGDAGEGAGSMQPDASLVVTESIQGLWQSTQDIKSAREFKEGGVINDLYEGKVVSTGLWVAFTKENAPKMVSYTIEPDMVYIQITEKGTQADTLDFKLVKLTPDELELVYLTRGGALTYKRVQ
jgi:hypothetical protein